MTLQELTEQARQLSPQERYALMTDLQQTLPSDSHPHITQIPDICGGRPIVQGSRVPVKVLVNYYRMGYQVAEILEGYPQLSMAQFYDALSYYYDHQAEIDADLETDKLDNLLQTFDLSVSEDGVLTPNSTT
ncbi:MAG: DUF433 domain-containing protein [Cyanobacteria bacterium P01_A01_bin.15]